MLVATLLVSVGILAVAYVQGQQLDVVYVPTPRATVERMLQIAEVGRKDFLIDLGSGDGRIPIAAGKRGARALGVDLDLARIQDAVLNAERAGVADRVTFRQQNLFETDIAEATVLTLYLLPRLNLKLRPKILMLRPGTRVVSHDFRMGDWKPDLTETVYRNVHLWVVPAQVAGRWQLVMGGRQFSLAIEQTFQEFKGHAGEGDGAKPLRATALRAASIAFTMDLEGTAIRFSGTADGDRMQGRSSTGEEWQATRV
jgi:hypothetical protein